jgi:hypothetical protein
MHFLKRTIEAADAYVSELRGRDLVYVTSFLLLLVSLPFSYQPIISLGAQDGVNLEINLIYITALLFVSVSISRLWHQRQTIFKKKYNIAICAFVLWALLSILWSSNTMRGVLTGGVLALFLFVFLSIQSQATLLLRHMRLVLYTVISLTIFVFIFCLFQLFADALGLSDRFTLLPIAYQSQLFGFARISGFSAEPEFLGNLLLAPLALFAYKAINSRHTHTYYILVSMVSLIILLTLSRGAIIGLLVVILFVVLFNFKSMKKHWWRLGSVLVFSVVIGVGLLVAAAQINSRDTTSGKDAYIKLVGQLSLGYINLNTPEPTPSETPTEPNVNTTRDIIKEIAPANNSGYVAESTHSRLSMSQEALIFSLSSPRNFFLGIGQGGFGATLHQADPQFSLSSIVNNQYLEVLVELGIIGFLLFCWFLVSMCSTLFKHSEWILLPAIFAILTQWLFFSGYPNVLHIWVLIGIALVLISRGKANQA